MRRPSTVTRFLLAGVPVVLLLGACASDGPMSLDPTVDPATPTTATTTPTAATTTPIGGGGGWIEGEPEWTSASSSESATGDAAAPAMGSTADKAEPPVEMAESGAAAPDQPDSADALRAGNVDDNADFVAFLDYLDRIVGLGITTRPFDPTGRIVVTVSRTNGLPAAGVEVAVTAADGASIATIRTTADGTARFLPRLYAEPLAEYTFAAAGTSRTSAPDTTVELAVDGATQADASVALDVLFLLDATGSMGDEIERLKITIDSVAGRIAALDTTPDVRFGMTLYRDLADSFVTTTYDFTGGITEFRSALDQVVAEGGDDYPEALDEGLAEALGAPSWRDPASTVQLVFLVADAPPQVGRQVDVTYVQSIADAVGRGIKVFPIASSESDDQAEAVFRQLAAATGARFVFLSGGASGAATGSNTDIGSTDYEELALDDLIVRLVSEELAALTGVAPAETTPPSTEPTTPPTNPAGQ